MRGLIVDPLTGRRVVLAENRLARPNEFLNPSPEPAEGVDRDDIGCVAECPFCYGNERETPNAVYQSMDDQGNWRVRVVPNLYPAFSSEGASIEGAHEVVIESPSHRTATGQLDLEQLVQVLKAYASRLRHWGQDGRFPYRLIFKNVGPRAGASLAHLHSQFVALPKVPPNIKTEIANLRSYARHHNQCGWCVRITEELEQGERLATSSDDFVALCPSASRLPWETWVLPRDHESDFECVAKDAKRLKNLAEMLSRVVRAMEDLAGMSGYNLLLHTAPTGMAIEEDFHWRIEIVPRISTLAGLELATGLYLNSMSAESAARSLCLRIQDRAGFVD